MRASRVTSLLLLLLVVTSIGCLPWKRNSLPKDDNLDLLPKEAPPAASLVRYLNEHARALQSFEVQDLSMNVKAQGQSVPELSGKLFCRKPLDFYMKARFLGSDQVEAGSNSREFWYWIGKMEPPFLYYCSYEDFRKGNVRMPFPFEPEWVLEALGMAELEANGEYTAELTKRGTTTTIELTQRKTSASGKPIRKVIVFNALTVLPPRPQVMGSVVFDADNQLLCVAKTEETAVDARTGIIYPTKLLLEWPAQQVTMRLAFSEVAINKPLEPAMAARLFNRPSSGYRPFDLARGGAVIGKPTASAAPRR